MNRDHEFFINIRNSGSQEIDSLFYAVVIGFSKFCVNFAELSIHTYFNQWIFREMRDRLRRSLIFFFFVILRVKLLVLLAIIQKFLLILRWK